MIGSQLFRPLGVFSQTLKHLRSAGSSVLPSSEQKQAWAKDMLALLNIKSQVIGQPTQQRPAIFIGNHISYIDIPLLLGSVPDLSFVAKQELAGWPVFGQGMKRLDTIFVNRSSKASRGEAMHLLANALSAEKRSVVIFPSGTTCISEERKWRLGAFRLAEETGVPLQPFRINYNPLRLAAFIDDDSFVLHLLKTCRSARIFASLEFAPPEIVLNAQESCDRWQRWAAKISSEF